MSVDRLPTISAKDLISALERLGFRRRTLGGTSHVRYVHADGRRTTVPIHPGRDIGRGLLRKILRDIELTPDEFGKLL